MEKQLMTSLDKYTVVIDTDGEIITRVNEKIYEGWKPLGGIAVTFVPNVGLLYAQAMIFERTWWE